MRLKLIEMTTKELAESLRLLYVVEAGTPLRVVDVSEASKYTTVTLSSGKKRKFRNDVGAVLYTTIRSPRITRTYSSLNPKIVA